MVQHCFTISQALIATGRDTHNARMESDAQRLAKLLAEDLAPGKVDRAALQTECGVSKQAISNWLATGRIKKDHLVIVAKHTKKPLSRYLPSLARNPDVLGLQVEEPHAKYQARASPPSLTEVLRQRQLDRIASLIQFATTDDLSKMADALEHLLLENRRSRETAQTQPKKTAT